MQVRRPYWKSALFFLIVPFLLSSCTPAMKEARHLSRADRYYNAGNYAAARIEYLNVLRLDPKNPVAYRQIGLMWFKQGDVFQAFGVLLQARNLAPNDIEVHSKLGSAMLSLGDVAGARQEALAILSQSPADQDAILLLSNATRTREEAQITKQQLQKFPDQNNATYQLALAGQLLRDGDMPGGAKAMQLALTLDPNSPMAHLAYAGMLLMQRNLSKAADEFKAASDLSPPYGLARITYAEFELQSGAPDKATAILSDATARTPDFLPAWLLQAQIAYSLKKLDDSQALVAHIFAVDPTDVDAHVLQSQIWLAKGDPKSAIEDLQRLRPPYADLPVIKYQLAQAWLQSGDTAQASTVLTQAVAASPNYTDAILLLAGVNLRTGNPLPVVDSMLALLKRQPNLDRARLLLASAYRALKQFDDAANVFRTEILHNPNDPQAYFMLGMTLLDAGNTTDARPAFEKAQQLSPQDLLPTFQLVDLDINAGDFNSAFKRVQRQIQAQPSSANAQFLLGKIYFAQKDWPHAQEVFSKALDEDPKLLLVYHYLAYSYSAQKKLDKSIEILQQFLAKSPNDPSALTDLADAYDATGQYQKARDTYQQLLVVSPDSVSALNNLAYYYAEREGDFDKAQGFAEKALALAPDNSSVADTLGWILYRKGDYRQALTLLQQSASRPPVLAEILYHLGMANYMMDDPAAARTPLQQAASGPGDFSGKPDIPARLAFLDKVQSGTASQDDIQAALKLQPDDVFAQIALGDLAARQGDSAKAAASYKQALDRNPDLLAVTLDLAGLDAGPLHDLNRAFDLASKARELAPADPAVAELLGKIVYARGDFLQAYSLLQEAISSGTDDLKAAGALQDFAWSAYSQGKAAEARTAMQRITAAAPPDSPEAQDASSFLSLTDPALTPDQLAADEAQVTKLLQATPDYVPALMVRAQIRLSHGDTHGAVDDYTAVLRRFPDFPLAQMDLAHLYLQDPATQDQAYDLAEKAHKALPDDPEATRLLAAVSYQRKDYSYAIQLLQVSGQSQPLDAESQFYLGMACWQLKEKPQSRDALGSAIAGGLSGPRLDEAKRVLAELQAK